VRRRRRKRTLPEAIETIFQSKEKNRCDYGISRVGDSPDSKVCSVKPERVWTMLVVASHGRTHLVDPETSYDKDHYACFIQQASFFFFLRS
jgi:hypothetical protein